MPTGEYPALSEYDVVPARGPTNGTAPSTGATTANVALKLAPSPSRGAADNVEADRASFWLAHLEAEVTRLHAKWQSIDAEFKLRAARTIELQREIESREATISLLKIDLQREASAIKAADERLASKEEELKALAEDRRTRDERIAALSTELADAAVQHQSSLEKATHAAAESVRLTELLQDEQATKASVARHNERLIAEQETLLGKLQDLEIYINGRHDTWAELNAKVDNYKVALGAAEKAQQTHEADAARFREEKHQLADKIDALERQCAELIERRKEREAAFVELEEKVASHSAETDQLKAELAGSANRLDQSAAKALETQRQVEALTSEITAHKQSLEALDAKLTQAESAANELTSSKSALTGRVDELAKSLAERSQQVQALRDDLRRSHEQLSVVQQQLSERTLQLAASQESIDQKNRHAERLTNDLVAVRKEVAQLHGELESVEAHAAELGKLRTEGVAEAERLKTELDVQRELVASLRRELGAKQAATDLLERSVGRITDLGARLAALDEVMRHTAEDNEPAGSKPVLRVTDFAATVVTNEKDPLVAEIEAAERQRAPIDKILADKPAAEKPELPVLTDEQRKLVFTIGGEAIHCPLVKNRMTIGRAHGADIRIASHFVSRVHARISTDGDTTVIEDAGSKNGLLVNSERIRRRVLQDGDVVSLGGELDMRFVDAMR
jgi:chromosome segregation ATPase